jgi:hypothetical protein
MHRQTFGQHFFNHIAIAGMHLACGWIAPQQGGQGREHDMKIYLAMLLFGTLLAAIRARSPVEPR